MTTAEAPTQRGLADTAGETSWRMRLRREPSSRTAFLCLAGFALVSFAIHAAFGTRVHGPTVFSDEMVYERLALSIGRDARLALFDNPGLSYSPLYSFVISPIYALGASAPSAYTLLKIVNAFLISLAIFPTYKIARVLLPRRLSLVVVGLSVVAPVMTYSSFTMSENLAYPLCLVSIWAMLEAIRAPSLRNDALLLVSIALAVLARIQLVVLGPAALTAAILAAALLGRQTDRGSRRALLRPLQEHGLLFGVAAGVLVAGAAARAAGHHVSAAVGSYAAVTTRGFPDVGHFLNLLIRHLAGIELSVGVIPFVAALVAAYVFLVRYRRRPEHVAFAAVAFSFTAWLLVEVAFDAALFDTPPTLPRIHERFLIYVLPLFLTALFALFLVPESRAPARAYVIAAAVATVLPAVIPFHTVVNDTINVDTFSLEPMSRVARGRLVSLDHATLMAVWIAGTLSFLYVYVRHRLRPIVLLVLFVFIGISVLAKGRIEDGGNFARSVLPARADWVDAAHPVGGVALISSRRNATRELETAFFNLSISRVFYVCDPILGAEFGEKQVKIDRSGRLHGPTGGLTAPYFVAPTRLGLGGRVVARNPNGQQVLVAPADGRAAVPPATRAALKCR